ncbi:iron permease FTR1 [Candidatus Nitrosoglobus terrae]|uniref:Iron permease FTR1 n=1 Tax=Candidatus Nitrosoglobus terrae TaxID=1630141 RepID=A0A1Q2SNC9_9GAMM|nr:cytochrome c/FTR1 family iron permease [Candidatus Nitrosoglobus terrae]BAW80621.1 iron permease FTR1 [Candidatus Nitrosoglobus terrae]
MQRKDCSLKQGFYSFMLLLTGLLSYSGVSCAENVDRAAQNALHMLDYISVDYPEFIRNGQVLNPQEYQEQLEFAQAVVDIIENLPTQPQKNTLIKQSQGLLVAIQSKVQGEKVAVAAHHLHTNLVNIYHLKIAPQSPPDLTIAKTLYQTHCGSCHGTEGYGNGLAAQNLDPKPSNFHDENRQTQRSIYSLFNTLTLGVPGTGMPSFQQSLNDEQRWALAFFVSAFPTTTEELASGKALWQQGTGKKFFTNLQALTSQAPKEIKTQYGEDAYQVFTYLRSDPAQLVNGRSPLQLSRQRLEQSLEAYQQGHHSQAQQLAVEAYLEGFELIESSLDTVDSPLRLRIEQEMMAYRQLIRQKIPIAMLKSQQVQLQSLLDQAQNRLENTQLSATAIAFSALTIIVREGLEAVLVVGTLISVLVRTGRRDGLVYVHLGWIAALGLGVLTWFIATYFIAISGASREITEGVAALVAVIILLYVGFWLHGKTYADSWQRFITKQVQGALNKRTLRALAVLSFLAVYREVFETILFYEALLAQAGTSEQMAVFKGFGAGAGILAILSGAIFYSSIRLPLKLFFGVTSATMALLAVIMTGKGIGALQEAGWIPLNPIAFPAIPTLGIYPSWQGLTLQALILILITAGFLYQHYISRQSSVKNP